MEIGGVHAAQACAGAGTAPIAAELFWAVGHVAGTAAAPHCYGSTNRSTSGHTPHPVPPSAPVEPKERAVNMVMVVKSVRVVMVV